MNVAHWRAQELKHHSAQIVWLDAGVARRAYDLLGLYDSKTHSGLNGNSVGSVERLEWAEDAATATQWLRARLPGAQQLVVVFGEDECLSCSSVFFMENWPDIKYDKQLACGVWYRCDFSGQRRALTGQLICRPIDYRNR